MVAIIGVDPHKHVLSGVALDERGGLLGHWHGQVSERGISALQTWAVERAPAATWAIESSNSLGRRLALVLTSAGADVRDVCPPRPPAPRQHQTLERNGQAPDAPGDRRILTISFQRQQIERAIAHEMQSCSSLWMQQHLTAQCRQVGRNFGGIVRRLL